MLATSGSNASGQTGGSNTKTITQANLPNVKLQVDSTSATIPSHFHYSFSNATNVTGTALTSLNYAAKHGNAGGNGDDWINVPGTAVAATVGKTSDSGYGSTGTIAPFTETLGSGTPLDITPSFYTVHIWKRLT